MLLFKPEHIPMIRDGSKTQTRRIWKRCRVKEGSIHQVKLNFEKGSKPLARIRILAVREERLKDISDVDCLNEGYPDRIAYLDAFVRINHLKNTDISAILNEEVTVVEFEFIPDDEPACPKCYSDEVYFDRIRPPGMPPYYCDNCGHEGEESVFKLKDLRRCRVCGCTDDNACSGGCHWVEDDLCSKCEGVASNA